MTDASVSAAASTVIVFPLIANVPVETAANWEVFEST